MPTKVLMPQLGESVDEGTITKWLKAVGEQVEEYESLIEVNTDKVDTEIPSPASGVLLSTLVEEGAVVTAGSLLAWIGQPGDSIPDREPSYEVVTDSAKASLAAVSQPMPEPSTPKGVESHVGVVSPGRDHKLGFISPIVARMAREYRIDLGEVTGTGRDGRITKNDVLTYVEKHGLAVPPASVEIPTKPETPGLEPQAEPGGILPLSPVRRIIAEHMVLSRRTSPHVTTVMEVDLSKVVAHRAANKDTYSRDGVKLTFTPYFITTAVAALKAYPIANSSFSENGIILHSQINIGVATSLGDEGLIVPVIVDADRLSLLGLAKVVSDLASRARAKQLLPEEVRGGTFTITNHGISGSLLATPIINQPQCAILGVGVIQKRVVAISDKELGDSIAIRPMVYLTLTFDHRILDGAIADYVLGKMVETLQDWD